MYTLQVCFGLVHLKRNFDFFGGENSYFPCCYFTMEKALFKIIFGHKFLFISQFSNFLRHFLRLMECKKVTWSDFEKGSFLEDGVWTVHVVSF